MSATILLFPPHRAARLRSTISLYHLDGSHFASAGFLPGDPGAQWRWIVESVAATLGCDEADVGTADNDLVTAGGIPAYMVEIVRPVALERR